MIETERETEEGMEATGLADLRIIEMEGLIGHIGDIEAKFAAGVIDAEERLELEARKRAFTKVIALAESGEYIDDPALGEILSDMRAAAAAPTQEEINAANIDYLMMVGGEW